MVPLVSASTNRKPGSGTDQRRASELKFRQFPAVLYVHETNQLPAMHRKFGAEHTIIPIQPPPSRRVVEGNKQTLNG